MTAAQKFELLMDGRYRDGRPHTSLWTKACRANNWKRSDRTLRLQKISEAVGRSITSTSDLNNTTDIDRVFTFLRAAADDLTAVRELEETELGRARRLVFKIREIESELMAWPASSPMGADGVRCLVRSLCADIGNKGRSTLVEIKDVEDLSAKPIEFTRAGKARNIPSQLDQLLITLTRMLSKYKKKPEHLRPAEPEIEEENVPF